jgi:hypothetical protein
MLSRNILSKSDHHDQRGLEDAVSSIVLGEFNSDDRPEYKFSS